MVTRSERIAPQPTQAERAGGAVREAIAGHPQGAVRRIILYLVAFLSLTTSQDPIIGTGAVVVAMGALVLLAMTDQLA